MLPAATQRPLSVGRSRELRPAAVPEARSALPAPRSLPLDPPGAGIGVLNVFYFGGSAALVADYNNTVRVYYALIAAVSTRMCVVCIGGRNSHDADSVRTVPQIRYARSRRFGTHGPARGAALQRRARHQHCPRSDAALRPN